MHVDCSVDRTGPIIAVVAAGCRSGRQLSREERAAALSAPRSRSCRSRSPTRYDAPMLKAAKDVAKKSGDDLTVFDAANDPKKQFAQFQT